MGLGTKLKVAMESWVETQLSLKVALIDHGSTATDLLGYLPAGEHRCDNWTNLPPGYVSNNGTCKVINFNSNPAFLGWTTRILKSPYDSAVWIGQIANGRLLAWETLATATKPQELALALEVGVAALRNTYYIKEQNGRVKVHFCVGFGQSEGRIKVIAKLPPGYLPASVETDSYTTATSPGDVMASGIVEVNPDGTILVCANASGFTGATGSIEFSATH